MQVNNIQSFGVRSTLFRDCGKTTGLFLSYLRTGQDPGDVVKLFKK